MKGDQCRYWLCFFALGLVWGGLSGQQAPQFSQSVFNPYAQIAAYGGLEGSVYVSGIWRNQWSTFPGQPESQEVTAHLPMYKWHGAIGLSLSRDQIGVQESLEFQLSYNYVQETSFGLWSAGISAGWQQLDVDGSKFRAVDGEYSDGQIVHNDPQLTSVNIRGGAPSLSLSAYVITEVVEGGFSLGQVLAPRIEDGNSDIAIDQRRQFDFFATGSRTLDPNLELQGAVALQSDFVQWQTVLAFFVHWQDKLSGGLGVRGYDARSLDALILYGGARLNERWTLRYSYDLGLSALSVLHQGSHEVGLYYLLDRRIGDRAAKAVLYNPRLY